MQSSFIDPPIVCASHAPSVISVANRQARRIAGTLRCLQRLRPNWAGNILTKDCINLIGQAGVDDDRVFRIEDAVTIKMSVYLSEDDVRQFPSFYWWPHYCAKECQKYCELGTENVAAFEKLMNTFPNDAPLSNEFCFHFLVRFNGDIVETDSAWRVAAPELMQIITKYDSKQLKGATFEIIQWVRRGRFCKSCPPIGH